MSTPSSTQVNQQQLESQHQPNPQEEPEAKQKPKTQQEAEPQVEQPVPRVPKRTPIACTFCRGRKLKCDGGRPSCGNCHKRGHLCEYIPVAAQK